MKRGMEGHQWSKLRRLGSKNDEGLNKLQVGSGFAPPSTTHVVASSSAASATMTVSELISRFDEVARMRLHSMNEKLRGLEMQMESFEAEMHKANDSSAWS